MIGLEIKYKYGASMITATVRDKIRIADYANSVPIDKYIVSHNNTGVCDIISPKQIETIIEPNY
jgi:hypothetical protein